MKEQCRAAWGAASVALALLLGAAGCGSNNIRSTGSADSITRVSIAPTTDGTIQAGVTKKFLAVAVADNGQPVTSDYAWSLDPPSLGTVAGNGAEALVTGKTPGTGNLIAVAASGAKGTFPITVTAGAVSDIRVAAKDGSGTTTVAAGDSLALQATGVDLGGNVVGQSKSRDIIVLSPAWTVTGGIGTIDAATGIFTAAAAGIGKTGTVTATVGDIKGTLNITVTQGTKALYVGEEVCKGCHAQADADWHTTAHSSAYDRKMANGSLKPSCVSCHVVGYGKGGWVDEATTPNLKNIQCENCHGPGSLHVAGNGDKSKILTGAQVLAKPEICGTCHQGSHHGTYEEWAVGPHAKNTGEGSETIPTSSQLATCGVCHGGEGRQVIRDKGKSAMPTDADFVQLATTTAQPCATCHDPHKATGHGTLESNPAIDIQLRGLKQSTAFYTVDYNGDTHAQIQTADSSINICGACHNSRNAYWQTSGRPPHHSMQYNMLIGDFGKYVGGTVVSDPAPVTANSAHRDIEGQCTKCHMYSDESTNPPLHGHLFTVNMNACQPCHSASDAGARRAATQDDIRQRMDAVKSRLDTWATTMAPDALKSKYGKLAWEYTVPGEFGNPNGDSTVVGPNSTEQKTIPAAVQQARWNLYIVLHDGSYGVHNAKFARYLLDQANTLLDSAGVPK